MVDNTGTTTYTYDADSRLTAVTNGAGATISYGYDPAGQQTSITYPNNQTATRAFNNLGQITSITDWQGNTTSFGYDPAGNLTTTTLPDGITSTTGYNPDNQVTSITDTNTAGALASFTYGRNNLQQITNEADTGIAGTTNQNYTYNNLGQLTSAGSSSYSYDSAGNMTTGPAGSQAFDPASQLCWTSTTPSTNPCTQPPSGATTYTYNQLGQRTSTAPAAGGATTYNWDQAGNLTQAATPTTTATYTYDGDGLLAATTNGTTTANLTWDPTDPALPQLISDGTNYYIYGPDNQPVEQINTTTGTADWYLQDQDGSTRALVDKNGNTAATYNYDAYGNPTTGANPTATTNLLWQGQYRDPTSGLYYLRARWYDPTSGQFLSVDPLNQTTGTPYAYGGDNPITNTDPTGLHSIGMDALHALEYGTGAITGGATTQIATALGGGCYEGSAPSWVSRAGIATQLALPFVAPELETVEILSDVADAVDGAETVAEAVQTVDTTDTAISAASETADSAPLMAEQGESNGAESEGALAGGNATANPLGGENNCVACAIAGDARLGGSAASALDVGLQFQSVIEANLGGSFAPVSGQSEITSILEQEGPGARGIVWGSRGAGAIGHVFNAVNQGGVIRYIDFQSGGAASFEGFKSFDFLLTNGGG
jgi:RHS repeat-associated protein